MSYQCGLRPALGHATWLTRAGFREQLTDEESVQSQLLEKSNVPLEVLQTVINKGVKRALAMQSVDDAFDEKLNNQVSSAEYRST